MFHHPSKRLRAWLSLFDDVLGDPPAAAQAHPHRRELRWERARRGGAVAPPPAHCISPVRGSGVQRRRERAAGPVVR